MINYLNKRWLGITIFHIISRFSFSDWTTRSIRLRDTHTQLPWSTSELTKFLDGIITDFPTNCYTLNTLLKQNTDISTI